MNKVKVTNNILIIKHGAFGDLVQAEGVLKDIRHFHPDACITLLTTQPFKALMQRCPHINQIIIDDRMPFWNIKRLLQLKRALHLSEFNQVYDLQNSSRTKLYRKILLKHSRWICRLEHEKAPISGLKGLVALLEKNDVKTNHASFPDIAWMADDVSKLLEQHQIHSSFIALIPGCSAKHPEKRWPYYAQLANRLIELGHTVVSILGPDEKEFAHKLPGHILQSLSWFELAGVLNKACYVIGNDTGPSHVASCLNKPGLAIFGPKTSAARSEIARGQFKTHEANDLYQLSVNTILGKVVQDLNKQNQ
ncbi:MAG TPA: glycosyltransferase family 9 protein [Methylotenera sp.]|nr:glycosyltransferase family 9 protein [Methylotenera sp.]